MSETETTPDPSRANAELAGSTRTKFANFTTACDPPSRPGGFKHSEVHRHLSRILARVADRKIKPLIIHMPPRHGKTRLFGIEWPAWPLGVLGIVEVVMASYAASLSEETSMPCRERVRSDAFQRLFPGTKVDPKRCALDDRRTQRAGATERSASGNPGVGFGVTLGASRGILIVESQP